MIFRIKDTYKLLAVFKPLGVTLFGRSKQLSTSQSAESMLSPRVGGRTYQGGSDILAIFMPNSIPRGKRLMSNTPSLGVHFV